MSRFDPEEAVAHSQRVSFVTVRKPESPGQRSEHVDPLSQLTPQLAISHVTRHVEPTQSTVLDSPRTTTSHVAPERHVGLAERPTVKSHVDAMHSGLALSPATTSQLAPLVQDALHELPHVAAHEAASQSRLQLEPSPLQLDTLVQPQLVALLVPQEHADPLHAQSAAGQGAGPSPPQAASARESTVNEASAS